MKINTSRLIIEEVTLEDAPFFFQLLNSPKWIEYIGNRNIKTMKDAENYIGKNLISNYHINGYGLYKVSIAATNTPIGSCGFLRRDFLPHPDLGFALLPDYEGNGYMSEAALKLIQWGIDQLGFQTIQAFTTPINKASQKLLVNVGFKLKEEFTSPEGEKMLLFEIKA